MNLEDILHGDQALLYMERYVDEGTRTYSPFAAKSEVAPEYQPRSGQPSFELVAVSAPRSQVAIFQADPDSSLLEFYIGPESVRFLIHPETWEDPKTDPRQELHALTRGEPIEVAPTASTRTVLTTKPLANIPAHFIKLHYPRRVSRFNRRLHRKNVQNSVEVSRDLAQVTNEKFAFLPDSLGFAYGHGDGAWGFLLRERTPRPFRPDGFLIPFFSLYGGDLKRPSDPPLLIQLIDKLDVDPETFVIDEIMIPVLECWSRVVQERGILLESHAQNILLEVDQTLRPRRIVHRDCDVWIDGELRKRAGLEVPFVQLSIGSETQFPREQHYSLVYDHFIGRELFDYLLKLLTRFYGTEENMVRERIVAAFHRCFPNPRDYFPAGTTYYFSNEILPGNDFRLVDMKGTPDWR